MIMTHHAWWTWIMFWFLKRTFLLHVSLYAAFRLSIYLERNEYHKRNDKVTNERTHWAVTTKATYNHFPNRVNEKKGTLSKWKDKKRTKIEKYQNHISPIPASTMYKAQFVIRDCFLFYFFNLLLVTEGCGCVCVWVLIFRSNYICVAWPRKLKIWNMLLTIECAWLLSFPFY